MATKEQYEKALLKLEAGLQLTKQEREMLARASQQAGSFGNRVRAALRK
jgi:hypothetical protein